MEELLKERFLPETKAGFISVMNDLKARLALKESLWDVHVPKIPFSSNKLKIAIFAVPWGIFKLNSNMFNVELIM